MRIALDAMGGDHAPGPIVAGAVQAVAENPDVTVVLVGDQAQVGPAVEAAGGTAGDRSVRDHAASDEHGFRLVGAGASVAVVVDA